ncbi:MAG: ABC transporter permease [bacterium]|nr:ABC transporter permease [bacterium]
MKFYRINALLIRHLYLYRRSLPRMMDIFYWPVMDILVWGFFSVYLEKSSLAGFNAVSVLLGAMIFWDLLNQSQKAVSVAFLEDIWEKNLINIFVAPVRVSEFLGATVFIGLVRIALVSVVLGGLAFLFYHFNIFALGFYLIPFVANLLLFGWILGIFTTGIILRYGTQAQILAFGFIFIIQPFSAVFYPVSALPNALQYVALILPSSHVFEGLRAVLLGNTFPAGPLLLATATNLLYLVLALMFFMAMFRLGKIIGLLKKLD